jgi:hypothetical protein
MENVNFLSALSLFTIAAVVALAAFLLARFLRKPENRHPLAGARGHAIEEARTRKNNEPSPDAPPTRR